MKLVTLDEVEAHEAELRRAHAENRAPALRDPFEVFSENLGNADSHLEEVSGKELRDATRKLHADQKKQRAGDKTQKQVIADNSNKLANGEGSTLPYQDPDESRHNPAQTADEKKAVAEAVDKNFEYQRKFDDAGSDINIPNVDDEGHVTGDSVNRVFTRKTPTFSESELVRENEHNSVPVPERYKTENPPQVIQQTNPRDGTPPTPETSGYVEGYYPNLNTDNAEGLKDKDAFVEAPTPKDVPHTAITTPVPEYVIGDETGTTRQPSRDNETDAAKPEKAPQVPRTVPLTESQVLQGAVKRPDFFNPPNKGVVEDQLSQHDAAGIVASLPVDSYGLRGDNPAHEAVKKASEFVPGGNVDPVTLSDEQKEFAEKSNNPDQTGTVFEQK